MDIRSLRYFIAAYECGSISGASRRCHVAQPSVSTAIQQLEARLGVRLLERHRQGITATEAGHRLYPLAMRLSAELRAIDGLFRTSTPATPVRLGLMRSLGAHRMSRLLKEYVNRVEGLALTLVNPEEPCDARIVRAEERDAREHFQPIWHDDYVIALPAGHPLTLKARLALEDLDGLPFIWRHPCAAMDKLGKALDAAGLSCQVRARLRTIEYAQGLVAAGVGASLVPAWPQILGDRELGCRPLAEDAFHEVIGIAWSEQTPSSALAPLLALAKASWEAADQAGSGASISRPRATAASWERPSP
ncbi:LysR family transcriptional regulator [Halomonas nitroreducens]|uniref:LysR family transcriptional regulator n=1 Tax=Halomonas nitroreducens TaxID=447425 RepID=A0A431UYG0_9GAMM|nr:LysR family transcriptional regulator [Halomonas nitroreducens]RTQ98340.1 LysR family transcriptional regulator [Halomonas nitroreducens]